MKSPIFFHPVDVAGQLTAAPPTCPGDTLTFNCTVTDGDMSGLTTWRVGGGRCTLLHSESVTDTCGPNTANSVFTATPGRAFGPGTNATSFSTTLSGTANSILDGTIVECFGPAATLNLMNRVGDSTIQIVGQYHSTSALPQCHHAGLVFVILLEGIHVLYEYEDITLYTTLLI